MQKALTICLPTYNRDWCVKEQINRLRQCDAALFDKVEILISDNGSTDNTQNIVEMAMWEGFQCTYQRHEKNVGPDGNFISCFERAQGKYVWLLGDDDFIIIDALKELVEILEGDEEYGLLYIDTKTTQAKYKKKVYSDKEEYMKNISYMFSFISANIMQSKYIKKVEYQPYEDSFLIQVPFYLTSLFAEEKNAIVSLKLYDAAKDNENNGGYNLFKIFVQSYLNILTDFVNQNQLPQRTYNWLKKDVLVNFLIIYIDNLLIKKKLGNFNTDSAWKILNAYYRKEWYYYLLPFKWIALNAKYMWKKIKKV